ncbi:MAG: cupin domain-containing protein [Ruminococcaceae bacterium]|jgi:mannose-6-phosphate isomerase-like protein (cupin superfamily)|nr:cupin domain-containing protein [Oscillospiraceae bacterium]
MEIKFQEIAEEVIHRMRDGEGNVHKKTFEDDAARIMLLTLEPGASIGRHTHETNYEIFYGVSGKGRVLYADKEEPMLPGCCHYCPQGHDHSLINDGDEPLCVFAVIAKHG